MISLHLAAMALALAAPASTPQGPGEDPLPWLQDRWPDAKAQALKEGKLVAVDVWATWCHSCLSMKHFVMRDPRLKAIAGDHVWLALDYDRPVNAAFFEAFPVTAFPTYFVIDPSKLTIVGRWVGSGTAEQMREFFAGAKKQSEDRLARAQRALTTGRYEEALGILKPAVEKLDPQLNSVDRTRLLGAYLEALQYTDPKACVAFARRHLDRVDDTAPGLDFIAASVDCAKSAEGLSAREQRSFAGRVRDRLLRAEKNPQVAQIAADDRSELYDTLAAAYDQLGDKARATQAVEKRLQVLEAAAKAAANPHERATFDAHRLECYLRLKRYPVAEEMLTASEKDFPDDYNPPARLALLYKDEGKLTEGLAAIDRALAKGYGPRRMRLFWTKVDLLIAARRWADARATAEAGIKEGQAMGDLVQPGALHRIEDQLEQISQFESQK